jgi:hypothetical protein
LVSLWCVTDSMIPRVFRDCVSFLNLSLVEFVSIVILETLMTKTNAKEATYLLNGLISRERLTTIIKAKKAVGVEVGDDVNDIIAAIVTRRAFS